MSGTPGNRQHVWRKINRALTLIRTRMTEAFASRSFWRQINRVLILLAVAALLWGVLLSQWRIVLIQARYL
jgi:hypothetical protein